MEEANRKEIYALSIAKEATFCLRCGGGLLLCPRQHECTKLQQ